MDKLTLRLIRLIFFMSFPWIANAQIYDDIIDRSLKENDILKLLPPLQSLLDSSAIHSPLLKMHDSNIIIQQLKIKSEKKEWMQSLGFEAGARYGLFDNLILKEDLGVNDLATSTTEQTRYNLGLFLKIPLSSLADKSNVRIAQMEVEKLRFEKEESLRSLRQLIIIQFYNVVKAHKAMVVRTGDVEMYRIQMLRSETDFVNRNIDVAEYARLRDLASGSLIDLENAKVEFITALHLLQETSGVKITIKTF